MDEGTMYFLLALYTVILWGLMFSHTKTVNEKNEEIRKLKEEQNVRNV